MVRQELGVYLLGTIDPAGRSAVDRHLADCVRCREELAGLALLPALLQRVPVAEAALLGSGPGRDAGGPPQELLNSLLVRVSRLRGRRRLRLSVATAALIIAIAAGWAWQAAQPAARPSGQAAHPRAATAGGFDRETGAGATVRYAARAGGTQLEVHVTGIPVGTTCQFWVTSTAGQSIPAGAWAVLPGQRHTWYPASVPVPPASLSSFDLTSGGKVLVVVPVRQASARPHSAAKSGPGTWG